MCSPTSRLSRLRREISPIGLLKKCQIHRGTQSLAFRTCISGSQANNCRSMTAARRSRCISSIILMTVLWIVAPIVFPRMARKTCSETGTALYNIPRLRRWTREA